MDIFDRESIFFGGGQGGSDTRLRSLHGIGREIDIQCDGQFQASREFDGFDAASLIKMVQIVFIDLFFDEGKTLALWSSRKRLIRHNAAGAGTHNRLKRKAQVKGVVFLVIALFASGQMYF